VITNVLPHYACYQDEIFGPVVTLTPFGSHSSDAAEAEAVALANDNAYALGAAVWTSDVRRAHRVGERLQAGIIWVNAHHRNAPDAPWGGFGASGVGRENGIEAFREYTAPVTMIIKTGDGGEDWFAGGHKARYG
jgi:acyl-CoA reductase-like NAD-dependent aldehyde dehydrogenase